MADSPPPPPPDTRDRLIAAALRLFGQNGFEGSSTRALARSAGVNIAAIAYHFGGKDGLRRACAEHVAERVGAAFTHADSALPDTPEAAMAEIDASVAAVATLLFTAPGAGEFVPFVLRELTDPGEIADLLFTRLFLPRHRRLCALWSVATGQPAEAEPVKLAVFAAIGQLLYFRIAAPLVARRMGWDGLGAIEAGKIADTVTGNLHAAIEGNRR